jgi:hypothetical protein
VGEIESLQFPEEELDVHMACLGLVSSDDPPLSGMDDQDVLEAEEAEGKTINPELMVNIDISADENAISHDLPLYLEAGAGLRGILDKFQLSATEIDEVVGRSQNCIAATPTDLFLKRIPKQNRYAWAISYDNEQIHKILSDVTQRLETLRCNKAVTERMNSTTKRMLSPFPLRTGPDVLLSRLTIVRYGNVASPKPLDSMSSDDLVHH